MNIWNKILAFFGSDIPKIGDIIVCIDDTNWNTPQTDIKLVLNQPYQILGTINTCHFKGYDIGARLVPKTLFTYCECGKPISGMGIHWVFAKRFRKATKLEYKEWLERQVNVAVDDENYIRAARLKKKIDKLK